MLSTKHGIRSAHFDLTKLQAVSAEIGLDYGVPMSIAGARISRNIFFFLCTWAVSFCRSSVNLHWDAGLHFFSRNLDSEMNKNGEMGISLLTIWALGNMWGVEHDI